MKPDGSGPVAQTTDEKGSTMITIALKRSAATLAVMAGLLTAAAPANAASPAETAGVQANDALAASSFFLDVAGHNVGLFSELAITDTTLTLKRGKNTDMGIVAWHQSAVEGQAGARKSATLTMYAPDGTATARYHLESAWPSTIEIGAMKAGASEILYETVVLTFDEIQKMRT